VSKPEATLQFPNAHPSHRFRNVGWNAFYCKSCGLSDAYTAVERPCSGVRVFVCPDGGYWRSDEGGECLEIFESRRTATEHWFAVHAESSTNQTAAST
jgi:hypothetical protein